MARFKLTAILSDIESSYGEFYQQGASLNLDRQKVPEKFWPLLPYARFWGLSDDWSRENLVEMAPSDVRKNLKDVVAEFDIALDEWLAGPEADEPNPSDEYIAFSAMRMAAYYA